MKSKIFLLALLLAACKKQPALPHLTDGEKGIAIHVNSKGMLNAPNVFKGSNFFGNAYIKTDNLNKSDYRYTEPDSASPVYNLKVVIDSTYTIKSKNIIHKPILFPDLQDPATTDKDFTKVVKEMDSMKQQLVECYPVLVFNKGNFNAYLFENTYVNMIQEAQDKDGKWKPIEFCFNIAPSCIPTYDFVSIKPKHYLAIASVKYHGSFKTKIRMKLRSGSHFYYSNAITGYINPSQFSQDFFPDFIKSIGRGDSYHYEKFHDFAFLEK